MKLIFILVNIMKKMQVDSNGKQYISFRIDEKGHTDRSLIFEEKRQKTLEKKLNCKLLQLILVEKILM